MPDDNEFLKYLSTKPVLKYSSDRDMHIILRSIHPLNCFRLQFVKEDDIQLRTSSMSRDKEEFLTFDMNYRAVFQELWRKSLTFDTVHPISKCHQ